MKLIEAKELKRIELEILKAIDSFCRENGLRYFLAYGTLIGAIRHQGFIPWDDDVDLWMPREDYNRFLSEFPRQGRYVVVDPYEKKARHSFAKVVDTKTVKLENGVDYRFGELGVDVDVFPLDGEPADEKNFLQWYKALMKVYKKHWRYVQKKNNSLKAQIAVPLVRLINGSKVRVLKRASKLHAAYPYEASAYVGTVESNYNSPKNRFKKEWFESQVEMQFENERFFAPVGYDEILKTMYGDYMQLPPKDKQVTHHGNTAYRLEDENEKI